MLIIPPSIFRPFSYIRERLSWRAALLATDERGLLMPAGYVQSKRDDVTNCMNPISSPEVNSHDSLVVGGLAPNSKVN